jgi:phosphohistidine phosphatase
MKTLLLMRHAKSSWKDSDLADHERPLNKRGHRDAPMMGQLLVDRELVPQRILSSSAIRARQTAEVIAEKAGFNGEIDFLDRLYMAEAEEYIKTLAELPADLERVMVVGHNPGLETLLQILSGRIESLPTAVIAYIALPINQWSQLNGEMSGEVVEIWRPKELRELAEEEKIEEIAEEKAKEKEKEKEREKEREKEKEKEKAKSKSKEKEKEKPKAKKKGK